MGDRIEAGEDDSLRSLEMSKSDNPVGKRNNTRTCMEHIMEHISNAHKSCFTREKDENLSLCGKILDFCASFFVLKLPMTMLRYLTSPRMFCFGLLAYLIIAGIFMYFTYTGYHQLKKQEFVSLDKNAGICKDVEAPLTGLFLATDDGKWDGQPGFNHSLAAYKFNFISLTTNDAHFWEGLQTLKENELTTIGEKQSDSPIHYNLLRWMHYSTTLTFHDDELQSFAFTAKPGDVFYREYAIFESFGQINSTLQNCNEIPGMEFDRIFGRMDVRFNYNDTNPRDPYGSGECASLVPPDLFGYDSGKGDKDVFSFHMDLTTMTSALSVNLGIVNYVETFDEAEGSTILGVYNGDKLLHLKRLFDPLYPRMTPMWCFQLADCGDTCGSYDSFGNGPTHFDGKCFLRIAKAFVVPFFHHFNSTCQKCPSVGEDTPPSCLYFDLLNNLLYLPGPNFDQAAANVLDLFNRIENSYDLNDEAFRAFHSKNFSTLCGDSDCSLIALNTYDHFDRAVSPYYYNLDYGHCNDSTKKEALDQLGQNPPSDLTERYYRCELTKRNALMTSVGIANSNTLLFAPIVCWLVIFPLVHAYHNCIKEPVGQGKHREDIKDLALKELISRLLDITSKNVEPDDRGQLVNLALDLKHIAQEEEYKK